MTGATPSEPAAPPEPTGQGGEAACWLDRVCEGCGALPDGEPGARCERCGAERPAV